MNKRPSRVPVFKALVALVLVVALPTLSCLLYGALASSLLDSLGAGLSKWVGWIGLALFLLGPLAVLVRLSSGITRFGRGSVVVVGFLLWQVALIGAFPFLLADPRRFLMARGSWLPGRVLGKEAWLTRAVARLCWQEQEVVTVYLDKTGKPVIPLSFGPLSGAFSEGLAKVQVESMSGYINHQGELVIPAIYQAAWPFSEGLAFVQAEKEGKFSVIDQSGTEVLAAKYTQGTQFSQGLAYIESEVERGYIDKTGKLVIALTEPSSHGLSNGLVDVKTGKGVRYLDTTGATVFEMRANDWGPFKTGKAAILDPASGMWGFVDRQGKWIIRPAFTEVEAFSEQLAAVKSKSEGQWGFVDPEGKMVIAATYRERPGSFHDGLCQVKVGERYGFIDVQGKLAIKPSFDLVRDFQGGLAQAYRGDYYGFIDKKGAWAIAPRFPGRSYSKPEAKAEGLSLTGLTLYADFDEDVAAAHVVALKRDLR